MSKVANAYADDKEGAELPKGAPPGQVSDSSYKTRMNEPVPVMGDNAPVEDPMRPGEADSDRQLERDEREAIDPSNMMQGRTRKAKPMGSYAEPTDEQMMSMKK